MGVIAVVGIEGILVALLLGAANGAVFEACR